VVIIIIFLNYTNNLCGNKVRHVLPKKVQGQPTSMFPTSRAHRIGSCCNGIFCPDSNDQRPGSELCMPKSTRFPVSVGHGKNGRSGQGYFANPRLPKHVPYELLLTFLTTFTEMRFTRSHSPPCPPSHPHPPRPSSYGYIMINTSIRP
jgi:hypothetical protein